MRRKFCRNVVGGCEVGVDILKLNDRRMQGVLHRLGGIYEIRSTVLAITGELWTIHRHLGPLNPRGAEGQAGQRSAKMIEEADENQGEDAADGADFQRGAQRPHALRMPAS